MADRIYTHNEGSVAEVLREMKGEALAFVTTRFELLSAEIKEKLRGWKGSLPMLAVGVLFTMGTFVTFTFMLVSLLARLIGNSYAWAFGFLIVCVVYGCIAAALISTGIKRLKMQSFVPERTVRVLRQDRDWLEEETRAIRNETRAA